MTTRRRLARLERLERLQPAPSCPGFIIAPERAQAIIAAYGCLEDLLGRHLWRGVPNSEQYFGLPDPAAEEETAARLAELLRDVRCPPTTGPNRPTRIEGTSNLTTRTWIRSRVTKPSN